MIQYLLYTGKLKGILFYVSKQERGYFETGKVELTRNSSEISFTYLKLILDGYAMISAIQLATISSINIKEVYLW